MKKIITLLLIIFFALCIEVNAKTLVNSNEIPKYTYIIGTHMYTRNVSSETGYDGKLTTERIMLGSRTINSDNINWMLIYYKTGTGHWINALTGANIDSIIPETFEIESTDSVVDGEETTYNPNYETLELNSEDVYGSTYVIGDYIYTRNKNSSHNYNGTLTTQEIMLAAKTIEANDEDDMIIYYKTARGTWINALNGQTVTPPAKYTISVVDLINQKTESMNTTLLLGQQFNAKIKEMAGNANASYATVDENIREIRLATEISNDKIIDDNKVSVDLSDVAVYAWYDNGIIYYYPLHYFNNVNVYLNPWSNYMFHYLNKLENIDLTKFKMNEVTKMNGMFKGCKSLSAVDLSTFDTSSVQDFSYMFADCESITSLDLSSFEMTNVTNYSKMLDNMKSLYKLKTPISIKENVNIDLPIRLKDSLQNDYYTLNSTTPTVSQLSLPPTIINGTEFNIKIKELAGNTNVTSSTVDTNITGIVRETNALNIPENVIDNNDNIVSIDKNDNKVYAWYDNGTIYYYSEGDTIYLNSNSKDMFANLKSVTSIDLTGLDTSEVTNMVAMFSSCESLTSLDLSHFNTSKLTAMAQMFSRCKSLTNLDLSSFDTSHINNMSSLFWSCESLVSVNLSSFDTSNVTDISYMFYGCESLETIDLSSFDLSNVIYAENILYGLMSLYKIKTPMAINENITISLPLNMIDDSENEYTEINSSTPTKTEMSIQTILIDGISFNERLKKLAGDTYTKWYDSDTNITRIVQETNASNIPVSVIDNDDNIISINKDNNRVYAWYDNGKIYYYSQSDEIYLNSDSNGMFGFLTGLTSVDLAIFNTSHVTSMNSLFYMCSALGSLDLSHFNTSNVIDMGSMFMNCTSLISLDLSSFDTSNVETMDHMFYGCSNLTSINLSSFNTSKVTKMDLMFRDCTSMSNLDLSNFSVSSLTSAQSMFINMNMLTSIKTPKNNPSITIDLPKTMYKEGDNTGITSISSTTPTQTILKSTTW